MVISMNGWDRGLDYESIKKRLKGMINYELKRTKRKGKPRKKLGILLVFALQLRNALRVSEALQAYKIFLDDPNKNVVEIRVLKKKDDIRRPAYYPHWSNKKALTLMKTHYPRWIPTRTTCATTAKRLFGANTHSFRYTRITYLIKQGINPTLVAKMTRHSNINYILHYTQVKTADSLAEEYD